MISVLASLLCSALTEAVLPEEIRAYLPMCIYIYVCVLITYGSIYEFINLCVCVFVSFCIDMCIYVSRSL